MGFLVEAIPKVHERPTKPYEPWVSGHLHKLTVSLAHPAWQRYGLTKSASLGKVWIRMTASCKKHNSKSRMYQRSRKHLVCGVSREGLS